MEAQKPRHYSYMQNLCGGDPGHLESIWPDQYFSGGMGDGVGPVTNLNEKPGAGWLIRLVGLMLIIIAALAAITLFHHEHGMAQHEATPIEDFLALVAFVSASVGTAMAAHGRHLFDRVEVASPWPHFYPPSFKRRKQ